MGEILDFSVMPKKNYEQPLIKKQYFYFEKEEQLFYDEFWVISFSIQVHQRWEIQRLQLTVKTSSRMTPLLPSGFRIHLAYLATPYNIYID